MQKNYYTRQRQGRDFPNRPFKDGLLGYLHYAGYKEKLKVQV